MIGSPSDPTELEQVIDYLVEGVTELVWQAFCNQLGLNISLSSGYHTQSNGQAERLNQKIGIGSSDHTAAMNNTAGVSSYPGQNTPRIPSHIPPLVSCHFSAFCDISHRYFHGLGNLRMSPWLTNGQDEVEKSGNVHMCICKGRRTVFMVFKEVEQGILFEPVGKVTPVYLSDRGKKPPSLLWSFPLRLRPRVAAAPERDQEKPCLTEPDLERHCSADSGAVLELPALAEAGTETIGIKDWSDISRSRFNPGFIAMINVLYCETESVLKVNGGLGAPFKVLRGIRQGCALSGMLYTLAIEPLLNKLRNNLSGFNIPHTNLSVSICR
ncbi:hypothetical protein QTP70_034520 [Hemibagrus guttatus]|uniref:Reverse transcriptase n=1 Tax=Hemibagrus guttatus TaxID=175788 RepID=A0AAE0R3R4_9TELE|nr:hypothetical protein QTP70_034520 [Hemibagrus guttatus]